MCSAVAFVRCAALKKMCGDFSFGERCVHVECISLTYISRWIYQTTICQTLSQIKWIIYWRTQACSRPPTTRRIYYYYLFASFAARIIFCCLSLSLSHFSILFFLQIIFFLIFRFGFLHICCALENECSPSVDRTFFLVSFSFFNFLFCIPLALPPSFSSSCFLARKIGTHIAFGMGIARWRPTVAAMRYIVQFIEMHTIYALNSGAYAALWQKKKKNKHGENDYSVNS